MLVVIFGLPGSGKSYFAGQLAQALSIPHLKSDDVRDLINKRGDYDPQSKAAVYHALMDKAAEQLAQNTAVITDATFHKDWMRAIAEAKARELNHSLMFIQLVADEATIRERVTKNRPDSDADFNIYQKLKAEADPLNSSHLLLDSSRQAINTMLRQAYAFLNFEPATKS